MSNNRTKTEWVVGHWKTINGERVWIDGYWRQPCKK